MKFASLVIAVAALTGSTSVSAFAQNAVRPQWNYAGSAVCPNGYDYYAGRGACISRGGYGYGRGYRGSYGYGRGYRGSYGYGGGIRLH